MNITYKMPIFELDTNVSKGAATRDVKAELAEAVASVVGVKAENMSVVIRFGQDVSFANHQGEGKDRPCGNAKITRYLILCQVLVSH